MLEENSSCEFILEVHHHCFHALHFESFFDYDSLDLTVFVVFLLFSSWKFHHHDVHGPSLRWFFFFVAFSFLAVINRVKRVYKRLFLQNDCSFPLIIHLMSVLFFCLWRKDPGIHFYHLHHPSVVFVIGVTLQEKRDELRKKRTGMIIDWRGEERGKTCVSCVLFL